ncbi:hypothetical protein Tcan_08506 [Toxocara canis]|uniref:Uncharacterized protein n=1 Tax=Toxocara canis TaxID=6265 RepID=A0A0B2VQ29_TOXCA|nr:hypothetical protein Tcan_08506 [Toxocara canis]
MNTLDPEHNHEFVFQTKAAIKKRLSPTNKTFTGLRDCKRNIHFALHIYSIPIQRADRGDGRRRFEIARSPLKNEHHEKKQVANVCMDGLTITSADAREFDHGNEHERYDCPV